MTTPLWTVAVDAPLPTALTYALPLAPSEDLRGYSVRVPLGRRRAHGVLLAPSLEPEASIKVKPIDELRDDRPRLPEKFLAWMEWLSKYYAYPIGQVVDLAFPPLKKGGRKRTSDLIPECAQTQAPPLTPEQSRVVESIGSSQGFAAHLLFGVTGSGKTEVYLRLIEQVLARGEQVIVLVPEIALTPQLVQRFSSRFGQNVAVIHSHLTPREKTNQWWQMVDGDKSILIGARSALFCPVPRLGLIVVDEEHEPSFKQEETLKYHARDAAVMLAKYCGCPVVLGSATPSMETWKNASEGRYQLHRMELRVENRPMPQIDVVDMRAERQERADTNSKLELPFWMSERLYHALAHTLSKGDQAALFLNRRGMAQSVLCEQCGAVRECPNCAISLTLHRQTHLVCHYCGYHENRSEICPSCLQGEPKAIGMGTELIEEDLKRLFPNARVARADRDEINSRQEMEELISKVENRQVDFLVGTQMIAKGLDFEGLNLVCLVMADVGFNLPDFRTSERAFQLITQMSGRSGRHVQKGEVGQVIIQTYNPDHPGITYTLTRDFAGFAAQELSSRRELGYPPFGKLACLRLTGLHKTQVDQAAYRIREHLQAMIAQQPRWQGLEVLGPVPAPLFKLRGQFRYHLLIKSPASHPPLALSLLCSHLAAGFGRDLKGVKLQVDIDPYNMM